MASRKPLVPLNNNEQQIQSGDTLLLPQDGLTVTNHSTAPATPTAGTVVVYTKADKKLYFKDDAGLETAAGGTTSVGGDPAFSLNNQLSYLITTSLASSGVSVASGHKGIIRSIQITNTTASQVLISAEISYGGSNPISLANLIPLPANMSIDLLERLKVVSNTDVLNLQCDTSTAAYAIITWEDNTTLTYFGTGVDVTTTSETDLYVSTGAASVIKSILLVNDGPITSNVSAIIKWTDASNVLQGYICNGLVVPYQSTVEVAQSAKYLPTGHKLRIITSDANRLEAHVAGKTA